MNENDNIPVWNLDSLFPSVTGEEFNAAVKKTKDFIAQIYEHLKLESEKKDNNFDFIPWFKSFLEMYIELSANQSTLCKYCYIVHSTETTNSLYLSKLDFINTLSLEVTSIKSIFDRILDKYKNKLEDFYQRYPEYEEFRFLFENHIKAAEHTIPPEEEELIEKLKLTGGEAWSLLRDQIVSNLKDENGKTFNELRNDAYSPDFNLRKESFEKELKLLEQNKIVLAASLNNLKGETVTLLKKRSWETAIDRSLFISRMKKESLNALISCIEDSLPVWQKYFKAKAEYLKAKNLTAHKDGCGLAFYDLFAPLTSEENSDSVFSKKWTFKEASDYVIEKYYSFSKDMGDFAKHVFDSGWIDAKVRPGKTGGAYDEDFPKNHESRILVNFTGAFNDILTLAHEIGHAYHFSCLKGKNVLLFDYPMTLAETASTFAETIVNQDLINNASGKDKLQLIENDLQNAAQIFVDILSRFYFESKVFEARSDKSLTPEELCDFMNTAQDRTYGTNLDIKHEYMWAVKSHYYDTEFDFYNYPYAFGQLLAIALYERSRKEGPEFAKVYSKFLSETGSMSCEDVCKRAGFDITQKSFWEEGMKKYKEQIETFVKLVKENIQ